MKAHETDTIQMSEEAKAFRRAYYREYRAKNRDRIRQKANERWERKALERLESIHNEH